MPDDGGRLLAARYRLLSAVGRGGMGTVWHAKDEALDRDVAVKEVNVPRGLSDHEREISRKRTLREARTAASLSHPGVVTVYDVVEEDERPWIVMELVRARSLNQIIDADGPLPPQQVSSIGRQVLSALRTAHGAGILHRDVKPSNVLLTDSGRAVLTDFGIATSKGDATLTQTGLVMGSPAYIAPERARGARAQPPSDLWSLGVTLYAAIEGRSPFERSEPLASMLAVITDEAQQPRNAGPLWPVLEGLLRKDPAQRLTADQAATLLLEQVGWDYSAPIAVSAPARLHDTKPLVPVSEAATASVAAEPTAAAATAAGGATAAGHDAGAETPRAYGPDTAAMTLGTEILGEAETGERADPGNDRETGNQPETRDYREVDLAEPAGTADDLGTAVEPAVEPVVETTDDDADPTVRAAALPSPDPTQTLPSVGDPEFDLEPDPELDPGLGLDDRPAGGDPTEAVALDTEHMAAGSADDEGSGAYRGETMTVAAEDPGPVPADPADTTAITLDGEPIEPIEAATFDTEQVESGDPEAAELIEPADEPGGLEDGGLEDGYAEYAEYADPETADPEGEYTEYTEYAETAEYADPETEDPDTGNLEAADLEAGYAETADDEAFPVADESTDPAHSDVRSSGTGHGDPAYPDAGYVETITVGTDPAESGPGTDSAEDPPAAFAATTATAGPPAAFPETVIERPYQDDGRATVRARAVEVPPDSEGETPTAVHAVPGHAPRPTSGPMPGPAPGPAPERPGAPSAPGHPTRVTTSAAGLRPTAGSAPYASAPYGGAPHGGAPSAPYGSAPYGPTAKGAGPANKAYAAASRSLRSVNRRTLIGVVSAVILLAVGWMVLGPRDTTAAPAAPADRPPPSPSASATPGRDATAVPEGFRRHKDRTGFSVAVPKGWSGPTRKSAGVFFYAPDRRSYVQIAQSRKPRPDALKDWRRQERATRGGFRGYERLRLAKVDYKDSSTAADWEFTWSAGSGRMHILDRGFVMGDRGYAILLAAPHKGWKRSFERLQPIFESFTGAGS